MSKPMIRIHITETDEIIDREMNDEEYAQHLKDQENFKKLRDEEAAAKTKKDALLDKLGITEEEAKLLLS